MNDTKAGCAAVSSIVSIDESSFFRECVLTSQPPGIYLTGTEGFG